MIVKLTIVTIMITVRIMMVDTTVHAVMTMREMDTIVNHGDFCINTMGDYNCTCLEGYEGDGF